MSSYASVTSQVRLNDCSVLFWP